MLAPPSSGPSTVLSPAQTLVDGRVPQQYSTARRYLLLLIFCLAQFLDAFNNSALFSAIPVLVRDLDMSEAESTWIISAFQLTFASFLLIVSFNVLSPGFARMGNGANKQLHMQSGRISDVYNPSEYPIILRRIRPGSFPSFPRTRLHRRCRYPGRSVYRRRVRHEQNLSYRAPRAQRYW